MRYVGDGMYSRNEIIWHNYRFDPIPADFPTSREWNLIRKFMGRFPFGSVCLGKELGSGCRCTDDTRHDEYRDAREKLIKDFAALPRR